jgi:hypothetical protein
MTNGEKLTIYAALANKLGREPSHEELKAEVLRILKEGIDEHKKRVEKGMAAR